MSNRVTKNAASASTASKVKVDSADTTAGFLSSKLSAGTGITFSILNPGGNEQIQINASGVVSSVFGRTGAVAAVSGDYTTALVTESGNLYFTNARAIASTLTGYVSGAGSISSSDTILSAIQKLNGNIAALTTGVSSVFGRTGAVIATSGDYTTAQVTEVTNLYFTNARAIASTLTGYTSGAGTISATDTILSAIQKLNGNTAALITGVSSVFGRTGTVTATSGDYTTAQVTEVTNLYFTNARAIAATLTGYTSGAGTISSSDSILSAIQKLNGNTAALVTGVSSVSGTTNRITTSPTTGAVIVDISGSYVGQSSITTLGTITTGVWNGTTIAIANGGTGQTTANAAFNALSPMTTGGDLIYGGASGVGTRLANGSNGQVLTSSGGTSAPTWTTVTSAVTSVSNSDGTLTISPTSGAVVASLALGHANIWTGIQILSPTFRTSGSASYFTINAPADTGITTNTESRGINIVGSTRTWVDGTVASQSEYYFGAPTYNKTTTSATFTQAQTLYVSGTPIAGTGVTFTNPYSAWFNGNVHIGTQLGGTSMAPISGTGLEVADSNNTTGGQGVVTTNTSTGIHAYASYTLGNDLSNGSTYTHYGGMFLNGNGWNDATFGTIFNVANQLSFYGTDGPTIIGTIATGAAAYMNIVIGGSATANEVARYTTTQHLLSVQQTWNAGLGAITQILGPTDQTLKILAGTPASGAGNAITITGSVGVGNGGIAGGSVTITGGASASSGGAAAGGAVNITGGQGSGTGGPGGAVNITSGGVNATGASGAITISTGTVTGTFGGAINITCSGAMTFTIPNQVSGITGNNNGFNFVGNTASAGNGAGRGSDFIVTAGVGSVGSAGASVTSGNGGAYTINAGAGGNNTNASVSTTLTAGNGTVFSFVGAVGGNANTSIASSTHIGGNGSTWSVVLGNGGTATGALGTNNAGNGGGFTFTAGNGGNGTTANGNGGGFTFQTGTAGAGAGTAGTIGTMKFNIGATTKMFIDTTGNIGLSMGTTTPTAKLMLGAGTTAASTAPLKFTSGSLLTTAEAGAMEFLTDKFYGTITTGAARVEFTLNNAALTSGTIPVATTNGRLTDSGFTSSNLLTKTDTVTLTGRTADVGSTNFVTTGAGLYRLAYYLVDSVADLTAGAVRLNVTYTDAGTAQTQNSATIALATLGTFTQGEIIIQLASGNIAYSTTHTGIFGTAAYNLYITLERLN